ncbi:hypothetical protein AB4254_08515 [Vibrio breoganii]
MRFDWSIDHSAAGGLSKASELEWKQTVPFIEMGAHIGDHTFVASLGLSKGGSVVDNTWKNSDSDSSLYSKTKSRTGYGRIGFIWDHHSYQWTNTLGSNFRLFTRLGIHYERMAAYGLKDKILGGSILDPDDKVITNQSTTLDTYFGFKATRKWHNVEFYNETALGISSTYNIDTHHLRDDLHSGSFEIIQPYYSYHIKLGAKSTFSDNHDIRLSLEHHWLKNSNSKLHYSPKEPSEHIETRLNSSTRSEFGASINYEYFF